VHDRVQAHAKRVHLCLKLGRHPDERQRPEAVGAAVRHEVRPTAALDQLVNDLANGDVAVGTPVHRDAAGTEQPVQEDVTGQIVVGVHAWHPPGHQR
jgi:hypothetical protein